MTRIHYTATIQNQGENDDSASEMFRAYVERKLAVDYPGAEIKVDQNDRISSSQLAVSDDLDRDEVSLRINEYWDSGDWYDEANTPASE